MSRIALSLFHDRTGSANIKPERYGTVFKPCGGAIRCAESDDKISNKAVAGLTTVVQQPASGYRMCDSGALERNYVLRLDRWRASGGKETAQHGRATITT